MVYVGIDVAKDKHDCFIANSDGEVLYVALSHAAKKLVRLLYHLEISGEKYKPVSL